MDIIKDLFKHLHDEFGWLIWGMVGLGFVWFFSGGPMRSTSHDGLYLKPPAPLDSGEAYGNFYNGIPENRKEKLDLPDAPAVAVRKAESFLVKLWKFFTFQK